MTRMLAIWIAVGLFAGLLAPGSSTAEAAGKGRKGFSGRGIDIARVDGEPTSNKTKTTNIKDKPHNTKLQPKWFIDQSLSIRSQRR